MTEEGLQFEQFKVQQILRAGDWQEERHADLVEGELFTFRVHSFTNPNESYLVVLNELLDATGSEFNGRCGCVDFETRRGPIFHNNGRRIVDYVNGDHETRSRCKHIYLALREFSRRVICRLSVR